jgi:basic membrane protein A
LSYAKGKAVAEKLYGQGCDVVFHAAGTVGKGVIRYAKDHDKLAIGVDIDQSFLAPSSVITSMIKDVEGAVLGVIKEFSESRLSFGVERQLGLADGAIRLAPLGTGAVPPGLDAELEDIQRKVISGELSVPETENLPG